jgi:hypothetical protein
MSGAAREVRWRHPRQLDTRIDPMKTSLSGISGPTPRHGNCGAEPARGGGGRAASIGAVALAFLASQHHNLHMLLLAFGMGEAAMRFMTAVPLVRDAMLVMSLAMVGVIAYQIRDSRRPKSTRVMGVISILVTLGLLAWSVARFGL